VGLSTAAPGFGRSRQKRPTIEMSNLKKIRQYLPFDGEGTILLGYRGSLSHGTYIPKKTDDIDLIGITVPPIEYVFGLRRFEQKEVIEGEIDLVVYEIRKYINLLLKNNPNVLSLLWLDERHYLFRHELGARLIEARDIFISKACYKTFGGYAAAQIRKMNKQEYRGYMGAERKRMVDEIGYDVKNAAHALRLLKMGIEILTTGEVTVMRPDAQTYIAIKSGEWPLEKVKEEAERLNGLLDEAYVRSSLPKKPDFHKAEALCVGILSDYYGLTERPVKQ